MSNDEKPTESDESTPRETALSYDESEDDAPSADEEEPSALEGKADYDDQEAIPALEAATSLSRAEADPETTHESPLEELTGRIGDRRTDDTPFDELFDEESVDEIDPDQLWGELQGPSEEPTEPAVDEPEIRTIPKRKYCHQCEYFTEPPVVGCTNEETEILEMPSMDSFRVADCPKILEDESLERDHR